MLPLSLACGPTPPEEEAGGPPPVLYDSERLQLLDRVVEEALQGGMAPGAVLVVEHRGQTIYRKAFGHRSLEPRSEPMSLDTIFDAASLTKVMATAASVMMLVEEGRISLSDRLVQHVPEFGAGETACRQGDEKSCVRLIDLLTHYSGLRPDVDLVDYWSGYATAIDLACREKLRSRPGERFVYSDIGYLLLAEVVRRVSGRSLEAFSRERIYEPLGMKDTGFNPAPELLPRIAPTEARRHHDPAAPSGAGGEMLRGRVHDPTTDRMGGAAGHAGLFTTADDAAIFARMILAQGELNGVRLLSPLGVRAMTTPQSPAGKADVRGLGFDIDSRFSSNRGDLLPRGSFGHTGFTGTSLWIDPSTRTFVILFTSRLHPDGKGSVVPLRKKVATIVGASLLDIAQTSDAGMN